MVELPGHSRHCGAHGVRPAQRRADTGDYRLLHLRRPRDGLGGFVRDTHEDPEEKPDLRPCPRSSLVAPLYGRLKGRGKEQTATSTEEITATLETWEAWVSLTLFAGGEFVVEVGEKYGPGELGYKGNAHGRST